MTIEYCVYMPASSMHRMHAMSERGVMPGWNPFASAEEPRFQKDIPLFLSNKAWCGFR